MDNKEIALNYKMAKNKKKQIQILAELNACSVKEIEEILINEGLVDNSSRGMRKSKEETISEKKFTDTDKNVDKLKIPENAKERVIHNLAGLVATMEGIELGIRKQEEKIAQFERDITVYREDIEFFNKSIRRTSGKILMAKEKMRLLTWQYQAIADCVKNGGRYE